MSLPRSLLVTCSRHALARTRVAQTPACIARAYSTASEFGSYEMPPNYSTGDMGDEKKKKEKEKRRSYSFMHMRERPSVLTKSDREKLEFRKKVREGKTLDQYNALIADWLNREDSYEALVTLMDMYSTNTNPDVETFNIIIFGHFRLKLPHKAIDIFIDLAPPEMKLDSLVYDRLVMELVKQKQYSLIGRLKFLVEPEAFGKKQVADVNISEMAVKWARQFYPEMGESNIQRAFGGYRPQELFSQRPKLHEKSVDEILESIIPRTLSNDDVDSLMGSGSKEKEREKEKEKEEEGEDKRRKKGVARSSKDEGEKEEIDSTIKAVKDLGEKTEEVVADRRMTKAELRNIAIKEKMEKIKADNKAKKMLAEGAAPAFTKEGETSGSDGTKKRPPRRRLV